jgi:hypothetical protein
LRTVWIAAIEALVGSSWRIVEIPRREAWTQGRCVQARSLPCMRSNMRAKQELPRK